MELQKCAACGNGVSANAKACPNCGEPPKKPMSRLKLAIIGFGAIGVGMTVFAERPSPAAVEAAAAAAAPTYPRHEISTEARARVRANSKDPDSLQFRNEFTARAGMHCGEVNGKNSFGGYTGFKRFITNGRTLLVDDGSLPKFTQAWRENCLPSSSRSAIDP
ncbi:hypothetical protein [Massilia sp. METH4]|uniref:hypothetical protein n=1 Tax=Massilia sp. METH4 TaxID=3123041 RepID=UPI0030CEB5B8